MPTYVSMLVYNMGMEIANQLQMRAGRAADAADVRRLLETAPFAHWHVDWHVPGDWLGTPNFLVAENEQGRLVGGLLATADPPPAAWVRVAAFHTGRLASDLLPPMLARLETTLRAQGVTELAWLLPGEWPDTWITSLGFRQITAIMTMIKNDLHSPSRPVKPDVHIRPVQEQDLPRLAAIEAAAFDPLWRHSVSSLDTGRRAAFAFDVAEGQGQVCGFQYCTPSQTPGSAHLVRLTVSPAAQGQGIGSALLTQAIKTCQRQGFQQMTLNTQVDNIPSRRLYSRFGFSQTGPRAPVWVRPLPWEPAHE